MKKTLFAVALCVSLVASAFGIETPESKPPEVAFPSEGKSLSAQIIRSTGPLFRPLGTRPLLGRDFVKQDFDKQSPAVAIISSTLWAVATGSRADIIGQKIAAGDQEFVVVAVAPKSPATLEGMKVWISSTQ